MPLARSRSQSGAVTTTFERFTTRSPLRGEDDEISAWQPAAPRLRLFSPAPPRPFSAIPASGCALRPRTGSPTARPISAVCGKAFTPGFPERLVMTSVSCSGAAPSVPNRASHILSKAHAIQARGASISKGRVSVSGAPVEAVPAGTAAAAPPLVLHNSPAGSPLLLVRSIPRVAPATAAPEAAAAVTSTTAAPAPAASPPATAAAPGPPPSPPLLLHESPPGSPLLAVHSFINFTRRLPAAAATDAAAAAATASASSLPGSPPISRNRARRTSMPEPVMRRSSSPGGQQQPQQQPAVEPTVATATPADASSRSTSGEADTAAEAAVVTVAETSILSSLPSVGSPRGSVGARRRFGCNLLSSCSGSGGVRFSGEDDGATVAAASVSGVRSSGAGDGTGSGSVSELPDGGSAAAAEPEDGGYGGARSGENGGSESRRTSVLSGGGGGSGRFPSVLVAPPPPQQQQQQQQQQETLLAASLPSPTIWPWPQDSSSRRSSMTQGSPFGSASASLSFLVAQHLNHNHHNRPNNCNRNPLHHLSIQLDSRGSTQIAAGSLLARGSATFCAPARSGSSAATFVATRSISLHATITSPTATSNNKRPQSSGGGGAAASSAAASRPTSSIGGSRCMPTASSAGGSDGAAVAAAAANAPASALYEIMPDWHALPSAAAAATGIPAGGRVGRAIAGILPSGNPGTFSLRLEERIQRVLQEGTTPRPKTASPKAAPSPPNPAVIKMLQGRQEAEAQRSVVDSAFSSGNPAAWMHQIRVSETAAAAAAAATAPPLWTSASATYAAAAAAASAAVAASHPHPNPALHGPLGSQGGRLGARIPSNRPLSSRASGRQSQSQSQVQVLRGLRHQQQEQHGVGARAAAAGGGPLQPVISVAASAFTPQRLQPAAGNSPTAGLGGLGGVGQGQGLAPGLPRHTSAETLHLQSMSYLASKEACRKLAADSRPPGAGINLRQALEEGLIVGGGCRGGVAGAGGSPPRPLLARDSPSRRA